MYFYYPMNNSVASIKRGWWVRDGQEIDYFDCKTYKSKLLQFTSMGRIKVSFHKKITRITMYKIGRCHTLCIPPIPGMKGGNEWTACCLGRRWFGQNCRWGRGWCPPIVDPHNINHGRRRAPSPMDRPVHVWRWRAPCHMDRTAGVQWTWRVWGRARGRRACRQMVEERGGERVVFIEAPLLHRWSSTCRGYALDLGLSNSVDCLLWGRASLGKVLGEFLW